MRFPTFVVAAAFGPLVALASAQASPVTFAQVSDTASSDGIQFTNNGDGTATLNTDVASGDMVTFQYENVGNLPSYLTGSLSAIETINNGQGVTTSAQAQTFMGADFQSISGAMTISYKLAGAASGANNLLTITIVPNLGKSGLTFSGSDGGTGASSSTSNTGAQSASYTETFSSDFLKFVNGSTITAGYAFSALLPDLMIDGDGLLSSFGADLTGTFSSDPPPQFVPEPATLAVLGIGLVGLTALLRRRPA